MAELTKDEIRAKIKKIVVEIRDEDADSLNTVGDAINYIEKRIADKAQ